MKAKACWMFPTRPPCFCLLGRYGDLIQMLPCFRAIWQRTGHRPVVITSRTYGDVLDGVSYVQRIDVDQGWWEGVPMARKLAEQLYGGGIVPQWWNDSKDRIETLEQVSSGGVVLQCHGDSWGVDIAKWPDYGTSMADRCGFDREEWIRLPLVFDRRNRSREANLIQTVYGSDKRPKLLTKFQGNSSPFAFVPNILNPIMQRFGKAFQIVNLDTIRAHRIYDLLGLIDTAVGVITIDTCILHLMQASKKPYVALHVDGWTQSVPKGNVALSVGYNESPRRVEEILRVVQNWSERRNDSTRMEQVHATA